ncbi:hypothetical protein GGH99_006262 [Coemansia sp. RSA 1285]|nr:hypothetical protein GGH99_006262 [Coemansia sp. RSA 1285]
MHASTPRSYSLVSSGHGAEGGESNGDTRNGPRLSANTQQHSTVSADNTQPSAKKSMVLGGVSIFVCIISFVFQTTITHRVQESYAQPFFILWISHSFWTVMLPLHTLYEKMKPNAKSLATLKQDALVAAAKVIVQRRRIPSSSEESVMASAAAGSEYRRVLSMDDGNDNDDEDENETAVYTMAEQGDEAPAANAHSVFKVSDNGEDEQDDSGSSSDRDDDAKRGEVWTLVRDHPVRVVVHAAVLATGLVGLLNASAYLWYVAVGLTSMSKVTAIYNMSCFFAYLFSVLLLKERVMVIKCVAVALSIVGVVFMTLINNGPDAQDAASQQEAAAAFNRELLGDLLSLTCSCGIGLYQVLYKKYAVPKNHHSLYYINFMTTLLGLGTFVVFWVPIPVLHVLRVEMFHWPNKEQLVLVLGNAFFGVAYNAGFMIALSVLSPLFAAIGVMLTIPVTAAVDMAVQGQVLAWNVFVGGGGILAGFVMLTFAEYRETLRNASGRSSAAAASAPASSVAAASAAPAPETLR